MSIEELTARIEALETEKNKLEADNLELKAEVEIWKPSQRVEIAKPQDNRKPQDFVIAPPLVKQFKIADLAGMEEAEIGKAIQGHLSAQLEGIKSKVSKSQYSSLAGGFYEKSMLSALTGNSWVRASATRNVEVAVGVAHTKGFVPFVSLEELRQHAAKK